MLDFFSNSIVVIGENVAMEVVFQTARLDIFLAQLGNAT